MGGQGKAFVGRGEGGREVGVPGGGNGGKGPGVRRSN